MDRLIESLQSVLERLGDLVSAAGKAALLAPTVCVIAGVLFAGLGDGLIYLTPWAWIAAYFLAFAITLVIGITLHLGLLLLGIDHVAFYPVAGVFIASAIFLSGDWGEVNGPLVHLIAFFGSSVAVSFAFGLSVTAQGSRETSNPF